MGPAPRNIAIVVLIAAAVYALPGGGTTADIVLEIIYLAFWVSIWLALVYVYRNFRTTIFGLGDRHRARLYGGSAAILFLGASKDRFFDTAAGTFLWLAILAGAAYALIETFRHWREYA